MVRVEIGRKIKSRRLGAQLTQAELADRSNLTKGFISQVENDLVSISLESLNDILQALGITLGEFFSDNAPPKVVYTPKDRVPVAGKGASQFEILVPGSTNKDMDPLHVTFEPGESFDTENPHVGEEFGYVLNGVLTLEIDKKSYKAHARSCFYFESNQPHRLANTGDRPVSFIWVTAPPLM